MKEAKSWGFCPVRPDHLPHGDVSGDEHGVARAREAVQGHRDFHGHAVALGAGKGGDDMPVAEVQIAGGLQRPGVAGGDFLREKARDVRAYGLGPGQAEHQERGFIHIGHAPVGGEEHEYGVVGVVHNGTEALQFVQPAPQFRIIALGHGALAKPDEPVAQRVRCVFRIRGHSGTRLGCPPPWGPWGWSPCTGRAGRSSPVRRCPPR